MTRERQTFFSLQELLTMAALAALGGVSSSAVSMLRAAVHALVALPFGMQFLAGVHVLWLVIAVGLIRKPGAATLTGLLKGTVELLSGNPLGLLVLLLSGVAGVAVDAIWLLCARRDSSLVYMLAGGVGAASNVFVGLLAASLPAKAQVYAGVGVMAGMAFLSGVVFGGLLGSWLIQALALAGVIGARTSARALGHGP
jgi:energy-coupling factor transport system substrate-specific component